MRDKGRLAHLYGLHEVTIVNRHGVTEHYHDGRVASVGRRLEPGIIHPPAGSIASRRANLASDVHPDARGTTSSIRLKPQRRGGTPSAFTSYHDGIRDYYRGEGIYAR